MSATPRPRRCSRVRYATTCSSFEERVKRNENGLRMTLVSRSTAGSYWRPFEVCIGDRIAVRIVRRESERLVDARLELLPEHVLQPVGLVVHVVDADAQRLREVELEQPVVPDHL